MNRKCISFLLCLFLTVLCILPVEASSGIGIVIDEAGLIPHQQENELEAAAQSVAENFRIDIVILTVDSLDGRSAQNFADDYYDNNGFSEDGVLFLLAMEEREWYISTCGEAIYALTDYGIQQIGFVMLPYLSNGEYAAAFEVYLDELPMYFEALDAGRPVDGFADSSDGYAPGERQEAVYYQKTTSPSVPLSLIIGLAVAAVSVLIMRGTMNSKRSRYSAGDYLKPGTYRLHTRQDIYLYSNISKVRRQQNNGSSHGGGSSVHRSSGGRRHGGGGGRF